MNVAAYARVSTQRQAQDQTITQQVARLQARAQAEGWTLAAHQIYCDDGYSGARLDRPALDRLRDAAARGECQALLLTTPDRLARRFVHQALLLEEFAQLGCAVVFLDQPLSQDPQAQLLVQIRGAVAEYERALIAERTRRGRLAKLQAGRLLPWIHTPYGYRSDPEHPRDPTRLRIEETEAQVVWQMFTWYAEEGLSIYAIAARLMQLRIPAPMGALAGILRRWAASSAMKIMLALPMATVTLWWSRSAGGVSARPRCGFARRHSGGPARIGLPSIFRRSLRGNSSNGSKPCGRCAKPSPPGTTHSTSMCCERGWAVPSVAGPSRGAPGDHTPTICATANAPWSRAAAPGAARCAPSGLTGSMRGSGRISVSSSVPRPSSRKPCGGPVPASYCLRRRVCGFASSSTRGVRPSARLSGWWMRLRRKCSPWTS